MVSSVIISWTCRLVNGFRFIRLERILRIIKGFTEGAVYKCLECFIPHFAQLDKAGLITVERFTEGTELIGAAEVQLQIDLIR